MEPNPAWILVKVPNVAQEANIESSGLNAGSPGVPEFHRGHPKGSSWKPSRRGALLEHSSSVFISFVHWDSASTVTQKVPDAKKKMFENSHLVKSL